jgi:hypothetical protein
MIQEQVLMKLIQNITSAGFTYLEVPTGQGVYTWNDYNTNGVQELQEFEVVPFIDQAKYIRVYLPNRVYIKHTRLNFSINYFKSQSKNARI